MTNTSPETGNKTVETIGENGEKIYTLDSKGNKKGTYLIRKGERVAQLVLAQVPRMNLVKVDSVAGIGFNRGGGFGSTGVR